MASSNKPILWLPFAGGGLVAALIMPVLILITGVLVPLGVLHLPYDRMAAFAHNPIGKLILFGDRGAAGLACRAPPAHDRARSRARQRLPSRPPATARRWC